ncbi:MAG: hypothetical protein CM15mV82_170 [uncultured marine virus]|nr:MAG: hypothetical protein CM15mV82_170 [uncultured marine virus]
MLDDFSEILQMPNRTISKDLKETIQNNLGQYMRTSYELFESPALAKSKQRAFEKYRKGERFISPFKKKRIRFLCR